VISGEGLDITLGGQPLNDEDKEPVLRRVLGILKEKYDLEEEDMLSAEIEAVPAGKARDYGLDRSMILGYGHDDRVCAYAEIAAMLQLPQVPEYTCCCLLADKEEIGSVGATGMRAQYFENAVAELMALTGDYSELKLRRALAASRMLSCDVSAAFDPNFPSGFEKNNAAFLGRGVCYNKFTGSRGKSGSNDANAEFIGRLRKVMDDHQVFFQTAELGRVDLGGGGTIAYICALYGMEVIDSGVAVLSMHAPQEIISKADLFEAVKAYGAFLTDMK
jgi:aspartyl aminopeptidase